MLTSRDENYSERCTSQQKLWMPSAIWYFHYHFSLVIISESLIHIFSDEVSLITQRNAAVKKCNIFNIKVYLHSLNDSLRKRYEPINNLIIIQLCMLKQFSHFLKKLFYPMNSYVIQIVRSKRLLKHQKLSMFAVK